jgi:hypothetical protein
MQMRPSREQAAGGMVVATLECCLCLETGIPLRTTGKDVAASSVTPAFGKPAETKKALYVVALSRSALRSFGEPRRYGVVGATTGTCEFGQGLDMPIVLSMQGKTSFFVGG